jgi:hypothetical protein
MHCYVSGGTERAPWLFGNIESILALQSRIVKREDEVNRKILAFSVSYDY